MSLLERLGAAGDAHVAAIYDRRRRQAPRGRQPARPRPVAERPGRRDRPPGRRPRAGADVDERARAAREGGAAGGQARARREAGGDVARGGGRTGRAGGGLARPPAAGAAHPALARPTARSTDGWRPATSAAVVSARARYGWSGPDWAAWFYRRGGGALFDLGVYNVVALCGLFGPARRVTAHDRRRDPGARHRRREGAGRGRGQRARADRLRRRPARGRHDRLHDAEVPLAAPSSCTARPACCSCSATTGRRRATSCGATGTGAWEIHGETDPAWPWTDGLRHLVRLHRGRARAADPARARLPRARDHAGRAGGRRRRPRARDHEPVPGARLRVAARPPSTTAAASTIRGQPCDDVQPQPASDVRRPDRDPVLVRHPPRLGRRRGGRGGRLDLRVHRQGALPGVRPARRTAPSGTRASSCTVFGADEWLCVLEGTLAIAEPRDRRGGADPDRRAACSSARTRGTTLSRCDGKPLKVRRVLRAAARRRARRARTRGRGRTWRSRGTRTTRCSATSCRARRGPRTLHPVREADLVWRRDLGALVGLACSTEHLTAGDLEVRAGRDRRAARARRRRGAVRHGGRAARAGLARRRGARVRARARRRLLRAGRARATSTATTAPRRRARCSAWHPSYA